jgi:hypothetical protein
VQVWVSDKFKFIYVRQPKSSSSAVMFAISQQLCEGRVCSRDELRPAFTLEEIPWDKYFVFTFVRNPWTRILSAYHMFNDKHLRR